jgi:hypothetical protein
MYKNFHLEECSSKMNIFKNKLLYIFRAEKTEPMFWISWSHMISSLNFLLRLD